MLAVPQTTSARRPGEPPPQRRLQELPEYWQPEAVRPCVQTQSVCFPAFQVKPHDTEPPGVTEISIGSKEGEHIPDREVKQEGDDPNQEESKVVEA